MKRFFATMLTFALMVTLAACTKPEPQQPDPELSAEEQLEVILAAKDTWLELDEDSRIYYVVTDLNDNGRLELIVCANYDAYISDFPSMWDSTVRFLEVSRDGSGLEELPFKIEGSSHPDMMDTEAYRLYEGADGRYLVVLDIRFMGEYLGAEDCTFFVLESLKLGDGEVEAKDIAWAQMMAADSNADGLTEYRLSYFAPGEDASAGRDGDWYVSSPGEVFAGYEELVCSMDWFWVYEDETADDVLRTKLSESWSLYSAEADTEDIFDILVTDPYESFYAKGAGGILYRPGDEVLYFPSFKEIRGAWYIQKAWTDDAVWYAGTELDFCELYIWDDGMLYADYSNSADPRGPYLLTQMKMVRDSKADGTDKDDWVIVYEDDFGIWQMELRPDLDREMLYVVWHEWDDETRSTEPTSINFEYSRSAG